MSKLIKLNEYLNTEDSEVIIESILCGSNKIRCVIGPNGGNNSDAHFILEIEDGNQTEISVIENRYTKTCKIEMYGPIERSDLIEFLEVVLSKLKKS